MGLSNLAIAQETVKTSGGDFSVRGLSLNDVTQLLFKHRPAMEELFKQFAGTGADMQSSEAQNLVTQVINTAPDLIAEVIALGAGENTDEAKTTAKSLTLAVQMDALQKIGKLTFGTEDGLKNVLAVVTQMMTGTTRVLEGLRT